MADRLNIGDFRIVRRLALGERSEVLLARAYGPYGFQRTVVLKRLIGSHAREPEWLRRLAAEAIAYARLSHSAIVRLYDFIELDETPTLVLEYVPGISLDSLLRTKHDRGERMGDAEILYLGSRVFAGLAAAHGARHPETGEFSPVIHRDVSPGNVLVSTHGEVKLSDFGVARVAGVSEKTPSGTLLGTYGYMAPEQIVGDSVTVRADVYGAALLLWEMLAGRHAFDRDSLPELEILQAMAEPRIPPIERLRPDLPPALCSALGRALRADADERIGAHDMLEVLRAHVRSTEARASLADDLGRARRPASTIPDLAAPRAWLDHPLVADPDATSEHAAVMDVPEPPATITERPPPPPPAHVPPARMPLDSDIPTAVVSSIHVPTSPRSFPLPAMAPRPREASPVRRWLGYLAGAVALVTPLLVGALVVGMPARSPRVAARTFVAEGAVARAGVRARAERSERARVDPWAPVDSAPAALEAGQGVLETPEGMANHRVFVDGLVRGTGGESFRVRCGVHSVRLGSAGRVQAVDVPCGGSVRVAR